MSEEEMKECESLRKEWATWFDKHEHLATVLPSGTKCYGVINYRPFLDEPGADTPIIVEAK